MPPKAINFMDPITGEGAPSGKPQYDPINTPWDFSKIPNDPGVYIWGMKVKVNGTDYFAPWYVGETGGVKGKGGLQNRIIKHYNGTKSYGASEKELFDFSADTYTKERIQAIYHSMCAYDTIVNPAKRYQKIDRAVSIPDLIYWQDDRFLFEKCSLARPPKRTNLNQRKAMHLLNSWTQPVARAFLKKIVECKAHFSTRFYFLCAYQVEGMTTKQMEHATKNALKSTWIFTTADAKGSYPAAVITLPRGTALAYDLWCPPGTRTIPIPALP